MSLLFQMVFREMYCFTPWHWGFVKKCVHCYWGGVTSDRVLGKGQTWWSAMAGGWLRTTEHVPDNVWALVMSSVEAQQLLFPLEMILMAFFFRRLGHVLGTLSCLLTSCRAQLCCSPACWHSHQISVFKNSHREAHFRSSQVTLFPTFGPRRRSLSLVGEIFPKPIGPF